MQFLTTKQTSGEIERIIREAKKMIILISPYMQISDLYLQRLRQAEDNSIDITMVFGKTELKETEEDKLSQLRKLKLFYLDNLHAKCYLNEKAAIITSMNLYEHSEVNNWEMGISIDKVSSPDLYGQIYDEVQTMIGAFERLEPVDHDGTCIRCGRSIDLDPNRPFCRECYQKWSRYSDPNYEEKFCHICGKRASASMNRPLCRDCFFYRNAR